MKLSELTPELVRRVIRLYHSVAYEESPPPDWAVVEVDDDQGPGELLSLFVPERSPNPGGESHVHHVLRLGNGRWPHMKIALMEFTEPGQWFFAVDTHDTPPVDQGSGEWGAWLAVRKHNQAVKQRVETVWRRSGVPTARVLSRRLDDQCDGDGPLVLVVDDEEGMRSVAVHALRKAGYRVVEAGSGPEALDSHAACRPDLVLLDYEMPGMDGTDVCAEIRRREEAEGRERGVPIVLATAGVRHLDRSTGADTFLMKPYHDSLLLSFVRPLLQGKKGDSAR